MSMTKIALSGKSGSGKSTAADYLQTRHGFVVARPGAFCRQIAELLFARQDKTILNELNDSLRAIDPDVWVRAALRKCEGDRVVIDGVRFLSNHKLLAPMGYVFWRVVCEETVRSDRLEARQQVFDAEVDARHAGELEFESIPFSATLYNRGSVAELCNQIDILMAS
jgi:dephospho-CoA kinase